MAVLKFRESTNGGKSLMDVVNEHIKHENTSNRVTSLSACIKEFRDCKEAEGLSEASLQAYKSKLNVFSNSFDGWDVSDFTAEIILEWFDEYRTHKQVKGAAHGTFAKGCEKPSTTTKNSIRQRLKTFFDYAVKRNYCIQNPFVDIPKFKAARNESSEIRHYSLKEAIGLLVNCPQRHLAAMGIALFAGIRRSELCRLNWDNVSIERKVIVMTSEITKTNRRRVIPIQDNLLSILEPLANTKGQIVNTEETWNNDRKTAHELAGVELLNNGLRKTFITNRLAVANKWVTAEEAGNSPDIIEAYYKGLVSKEEGESYFSISLKEKANIVNIASL